MRGNPGNTFNTRESKNARPLRTERFFIQTRLFWDYLVSVLNVGEAGFVLHGCEVNTSGLGVDDAMEHGGELGAGESVARPEEVGVGIAGHVLVEVAERDGILIEVQEKGKRPRRGAFW